MLSERFDYSNIEASILKKFHHNTLNPDSLNIIVSGNKKTDENVIRRELDIFPGEKFNRNKLYQSVTDLWMLNFFGDIIPKVNPISENEIDLEIEVLEKSVGTANFSMGYNEYSGFSGGGGFEFIAPAAKRVSSAELYIGAVEVGVGLIPGAGGNLRLIINMMENSGKTGRLNVFPIVQKAFETIGFAKVATSAEEAKHLGYLLKTDTIVMNLDYLLWSAKEAALELSEN